MQWFFFDILVYVKILFTYLFIYFYLFSPCFHFVCFKCISYFRISYFVCLLLYMLFLHSCVYDVTVRHPCNFTLNSSPLYCVYGVNNNRSTDVRNRKRMVNNFKKKNISLCVAAYDSGTEFIVTKLRINIYVIYTGAIIIVIYVLSTA